MADQDNPFAPQSGYGAANVQYGTTQNATPTPITSAPPIPRPVPVNAQSSSASSVAAPSAASMSLMAGTGGQVQAAPTKDTTTAGFKADVIDASQNQVILVDFWAPWCGPCKQLAPMLEQVVAETNGAAALVKMNIDEHPSVAGQLGIKSIPAVIAFKDGKPIDGFMGAVPESELRAFIAKVAGPEVDPEVEILEAAEAARQEGDIQKAAQIFAMALQQGFASAQIFAGLGECLLDLDDKDGVNHLLSQVPKEMHSDPAFSKLDARLKLMKEVGGLGDANGLLQRIAEDDSDYDAMFELSAIRNAEGQLDEAADLLLAIMKADRSWNEDGARKRLLEYFEAWGNANPATKASRRKLSTLFFS